MLTQNNLFLTIFLQCYWNHLHHDESSKKGSDRCFFFWLNVKVERHIKLLNTELYFDAREAKRTAAIFNARGSCCLIVCFSNTQPTIRRDLRVYLWPQKVRSADKPFSRNSKTLKLGWSRNSMRLASFSRPLTFSCASHFSISKFSRNMLPLPGAVPACRVAWTNFLVTSGVPSSQIYIWNSWRGWLYLLLG